MHLRLQRSPVGSGEKILPGIFLQDFRLICVGGSALPSLQTFFEPAGMRPSPARAFPDAGSCRCGVLPAERRFAPVLTAVNADADLTARAAQPAAGSA